MGTFFDDIGIVNFKKNKMIIYFVIIGIFALIGSILSGRLKRVMKKYGKQRISNGMTGAEIAQKMLNDNGLYDVKITQVNGQLTDHYNPRTKTVNLSQAVYNNASVSSAAVAAHECGHAVQHATEYGALKLRSAMVPVVSVANRMMSWILMIGFIGGFAILSNFEPLLIGVIIAQAALALFSLVTLPVEFNASKRATIWLEEARITDREETAHAKVALRWAASTYVVAALASITQLLFFVLMLVARD